VVKILLKHGAKVDARTYKGYTSLKLASERHHCEVARILLEHGADVKAEVIVMLSDFFVPTGKEYMDTISRVAKEQREAKEAEKGEQKQKKSKNEASE